MLCHTLPESVANLEKIGISEADAFQLRRISMTLHRWHELECGTSEGAIERDETTDKPFWRYQASRWNASLSTYEWSTRRHPIADREAGAKRRLNRIMARYPHLTAYVQPDPRGCALYILRPGDVPAGEQAESYYSRGIAVYK